MRRTVGFPRSPPELQESIEVVDQTLRRVARPLRALRPSLLDDLGLVPALRWYVDRQSQRGGSAVHLRGGRGDRAAGGGPDGCFRIAQEALTNVCATPARDTSTSFCAAAARCWS
jgi:signal transduction histidine kinase